MHVLIRKKKQQSHESLRAKQARMNEKTSPSIHPSAPPREPSRKFMYCVICPSRNQQGTMYCPRFVHLGRPSPDPPFTSHGTSYAVGSAKVVVPRQRHRTTHGTSMPATRLMGNKNPYRPTYARPTPSLEASTTPARGI